jgi:Circadian oscillating protein COP23
LKTCIIQSDSPYWEYMPPLVPNLGVDSTKLRSFIYAKIMKNILLSVVLTVGLVITTIDYASAETAIPESSTTAKFYCGTAKDPSSKNRELPATLFTSAEVQEPQAIIIWKSEYFGSKFAAQKRCEVVSPKFQTAFVDEGRTNLAAVVDRVSGLGMICALSDSNQACDPNHNMLYTLKSYKTAEATIDELNGIFGNKLAIPRYESAGRVVVNLQKLLHRK